MHKYTCADDSLISCLLTDIYYAFKKTYFYHLCDGTIHVMQQNPKGL